MHRVHMAEDQDAGLGLVRMRKARAHAIAEAHAAGNALDARAHDGEVARRQVHHAVDGRGIEGRAFALDPGSQARQHRARVERKITRVHRGSLSCWRPSRVAIQIVCFAPARDLLARTPTSSTSKPALRRRWVNFKSGLAAHTASTPPARSAARAALNPCEIVQHIVGVARQPFRAIVDVEQDRVERRSDRTGSVDRHRLRECSRAGRPDCRRKHRAIGPRAHLTTAGTSSATVMPASGPSEESAARSVKPMPSPPIKIRGALRGI